MPSLPYLEDAVSDAASHATLAAVATRAAVRAAVYDDPMYAWKASGEHAEAARRAATLAADAAKRADACARRVREQGTYAEALRARAYAHAHAALADAHRAEDAADTAARR